MKSNPKVKAVIFDWAGTTVDYGCFAPVQVFVEIFAKRGVEITVEEAREPMGLLKIDHIRALLQMERIAQLWVTVFNREPKEEDVQSLYLDFEEMLFKVLKNYAKPIPGVLPLMSQLREQGIKIGTTTGYTREMINIVADQAKQVGYEPDSIIASNDVKEGRPAPWMCYQTAMNLNVYPLSDMIKVGDTVVDIQEGKNAGMWTVGILKGGSELGLSEAEVNELSEAELRERMQVAEKKFLEVGADFVIDEVGNLLEVIETINRMNELENQTVKSV